MALQKSKRLKASPSVQYPWRWGEFNYQGIKIAILGRNTEFSQRVYISSDDVKKLM